MRDSVHDPVEIHRRIDNPAALPDKCAGVKGVDFMHPKAISDSPPPPRPKCGEIWMCNLSAREGSVQTGSRPVFVLSNDLNNTYSPTLNIIPITSQKKKRIPVHVDLFSYQKYGLSRPSTMLVEQTTTVSVESMVSCIGKVTDPQILSDISSAICIQFPILQSNFIK